MDKKRIIQIIITIVIIAIGVIFLLLKNIYIHHHDLKGELYYNCVDGEIRPKEGVYGIRSCAVASKNGGLIPLKKELYCDENNNPVYECKISLYDKLFRNPSDSLSW